MKPGQNTQYGLTAKAYFSIEIRHFRGYIGSRVVVEYSRRAELTAGKKGITYLESGCASGVGCLGRQRPSDCLLR